MKIFSNFDTNLPRVLYDAAKKRYGEKNACFVRRDMIYLRLKVVPQAFVYVLLVVLILWSVYIDWSRYLIIFWRIFVWILSVVAKFYIVDKLIDYFLDFVIITPNNVTSYDQEGIFYRKTKSMDLSKIKSINVKQKWFSMSVFNYGNIVFFSEWDEQMWDIMINYVYNPRKLRDKIAEIIYRYYRISDDEVIRHDQTNPIPPSP